MGVRLAIAVAATAALSACVGADYGIAPRALAIPGYTPTPQPSPARVVTPPPSLSPLPPAVPSTGRILYGLVTLRSVTEPYFAHNQAGFQLLATAAGQALVTFTTLEYAPVRFGQDAVTTLTDDQGRFTVTGQLPKDGAFVASAALANGHRLSALALAGTQDLTLDEASSMVAEMARFQVPTEATADVQGPLALKSWPADAVTTLYNQTVALLAPGAFVPATQASPLELNSSLGKPASAAPVIPDLQAGAGFRLRHRYVALFGSQVTAKGNTHADQVSDQWKALLGFRPLAVTVVAGGAPRDGVPSVGGLLAPTDPGDDHPAEQTALAGPTDVAADPAGNLWIAEHDAHALRLLPAASRGALLGWTQNMTVGRLYTVLGGSEAALDKLRFDALYRSFENASVENPDAAPMGTAFPLFAPRRVLLEPVSVGEVPSVYVASDDGDRVFWVPAINMTRYGRQVHAGRVYTLAGNGLESATAEGDGGPAWQAKVTRPAAIAKAATTNDLFVLDAGSGAVRVVRAATGTIASLPLTEGGQPLRFTGATDMRLVDTTLFVTDPKRGVVWRIALPATLGDPIAALPAVPVLGSGSGVVATPAPANLYAPNGALPKAKAAFSGLAALDFDAAGNLWVAETDPGRLRLLDASGVGGDGGSVWTPGGAYVTPPGAAGAADVLTGDARLAGFPGTTALVREASGDMLVVDRRANVVRRLWLRRGSL